MVPTGILNPFHLCDMSKLLEALRRPRVISNDAEKRPRRLKPQD
jgi:hypothetical protein